MRVFSFTKYVGFGVLFVGSLFATTVLANQGVENLSSKHSCGQIVEEINQINSSYSEKKSANPLILLADVVGSIGNKRRIIAKEKRVDHLIGLMADKACESSGDLNLQIKHESKNEQSKSGSQRRIGSLTVPALDILELAHVCVSPNDRGKRVYTLGLENIDPAEYLRFFTVGGRTSHQIFRAAHLLYGEIRLPRMIISSRSRKKNAGLWVERISTGERIQLSWLPPDLSCNSKGIVTIDYYNLWVAVQTER